MGREIRRVPKNWKHPRRKDGSYQPMFDETHKEAADKWLAGCIAWANRDLEKLRELGQWIGATPEDTERIFREHPYFWQWTDDPPDPDYYRPEWTEPADHFQLYETMTEGTPISPVFADVEELYDWAETNASWWASSKATREEWKSALESGSAGLVEIVLPEEDPNAR